jgi:hypothetical protein
MRPRGPRSGLSAKTAVAAGRREKPTTTEIARLFDLALFCQSGSRGRAERDRVCSAKIALASRDARIGFVLSEFISVASGIHRAKPLLVEFGSTNLPRPD